MLLNCLVFFYIQNLFCILLLSEFFSDMLLNFFFFHMQNLFVIFFLTEFFSDMLLNVAQRPELLDGSLEATLAGNLASRKNSVDQPL